jgi:pimeloyl-ACP methyl ester carboxylesterase
MRRLLVVMVIAIAALVALFIFGRTPAPVDALPAGPTLAIDSGIRRLDLRFPCGETKCAGWLYLPTNNTSPGIVVMGHGFAGTRDVALPLFAEKFARSGVAAFVFDYRHFGASGGAPRQLVDPWRQLEDWRAALAFVRTRSDVDSGRIALWGTSLGAGLALSTAADDREIRAVVVQAPQIDTDIEGEASFPGVWWAVRLVLTGWWDLIWTRLTGEAVTIPALAPKEEWGMLVDDSAYAAFESLVADESTYRNEVVAHSIFEFDAYNPALRTMDIEAPVLLIASRGDRFAPFTAVETFAARAKNATIVEFSGDHFDVYKAPAAEIAADAATSFLRQHLSIVETGPEPSQ